MITASTRDSRKQQHYQPAGRARANQVRAQKPVYYAVYKPYDMLSQFTDSSGRATLKLIGSFPPDVYPVGRLDMDSEGLLLLTNDKPLTDLLLNPAYSHEREYYAQVEGIIKPSELEILEKGVIIEEKKTKPARALAVEQPGWITPRNPALWFKPSLHYAWLRLIITEGRNRQVRKMTARVGHPTVRLVRYRIANITLDGLQPGQFRELTPNEIACLKKAIQR